MTDDDTKQIIETREALHALRVRQQTHGFRIAQLEAQALHAPATAGSEGPQGQEVPPGPAGPQGAIGPMPAHRWQGTSLQFEQAPGERWGELVNLKGEPGKAGKQIFVGGGGGSATTVTTTCNGYMPQGW